MQPASPASSQPGSRAARWANCYHFNPQFDYSMLELSILQHYYGPTCQGPGCSLCAAGVPKKLLGPQGPTGHPGAQGPVGPSNPFVVGDWVWSIDYKYRSAIRGTVVATNGYHVYLKLEWPMPYLGEEGVCPRVYADRLVKPHLLERIAFAASEDGERLRYRRGFRIRLSKQEFQSAIR